MIKYKVTLTPLSNVHIGTGNELSPFDYNIIEENNSYYMIRFNLNKLISDMDSGNKNKLLSFMDKNDNINIRRIIKENIKENHIFYKSEVTRDFFNKFSRKFDDINNQLLINEIYRNKLNYNPVIPGSSIKGSIRTALLNFLANNDKNNYANIKDNYFESEILGYKNNTKEDPFRALHIADCEIKGEKKEIVTEIFNFSNKSKSDPFLNMSIAAEQIKGTLLGGDSLGETIISIDNDLQNSEYEDKNQNIRKALSEKLIIDIKKILNSCNEFYINNMEKEHKKFYIPCASDDLFDNSKNLLDTANAINKEKECILRLGRFSQIENVTIEKYRKPATKKGYGKTRMISDKKAPLGWVKLSFEEIK